MRTLLFILAAVAALSVATDVNCNITISDTKNHHSYNFDLTPLHHPDSVFIDSLWYRTAENNIYYINFCGKTASACEGTDTSVCYRTPDGQDFKYINAGSTSTQKAELGDSGSPDKTIIVTYSNGDQCSSGTYTTHLRVECQLDANPGFFHDIKKTNDCEVTLYMFSQSGCGVDVPYVDPDDSSAADGGEVFAIIVLVVLLVAVVAYFVGGALYQWKVNGATSASEMIIHREFWCSLPSLVVDGVKFIFHGCKRGDYVSV